MTEDVYSRLDQLVGEEKSYKGAQITIVSFKEVNQTIVVKTNSRTLVFTQIEIDDFFKDLKDVSEVQESLPLTVESQSMNVSVNGYQPSAENQTLKASLLSVLEDIKTKPSKKNREKAKAVCDVANTMVNIQKAEIQMINAIKRK